MKFWRPYRQGFLVGTILLLIFLLVPDFTPIHAVASPTNGWTRLSDPVAVGGVITHLVAAPSNPDSLYALQKLPVFASSRSKNLYHSQDGGVTWQIVPADNHSFTSLAIDPQDADTLYATDNDQLWKSTDGGLNWVMLYPFGMQVVVPTSDRIYLISTLPGNSSCTYDHSEFAHSLDGGATWEYFSFSCGQTIGHIFVAPEDPDHIFASSTSYSYPSQVSQDGGLTWQSLLLFGPNNQFDDMAFDPQIADRAYLAVDNGVLWTENDGETWSECGAIPKGYPFKLLTSGIESTQSQHTLNRPRTLSSQSTTAKIIVPPGGSLFKACQFRY